MEAKSVRDGLEKLKPHIGTIVVIDSSAMAMADRLDSRQEGMVAYQVYLFVE